MVKPIIAVDIDDVLALSAKAFVAYSNEKYDLSLTLDDVDENWAKMWQIDIDETWQRAHEYHASGHMSTYERDEIAVRVLRKLSKNFTLIVTTSRNKAVMHLTRTWLEENYPGVFAEVYFAGIYDREVPHFDMLKMTKTQMLIDLGADYLIDDQPKHCIGAVESGKRAILFGEYPWNVSAEVPKDVVRCANWFAVEEYFAERK